MAMDGWKGNHEIILLMSTCCAEIQKLALQDWSLSQTWSAVTMAMLKSQTYVTHLENSADGEKNMKKFKNLSNIGKFKPGYW